MGAPGKGDKVKRPVFHPTELVRGWRILRQHLRLRIDIQRRKLSGTAIFNFCAINNQCTKVSLNLRRCHVKACYVNGKKAATHHVSPLDDNELLQKVSSLNTKHRLKDVDHSIKTRRRATETHPELVIDLPATVSADIVDDLERIKKNHPKDTSKHYEYDVETAPAVPLEQLPLFNIVIEYEMLDSTVGAIYYGDPNSNNPTLDPIYMLTESRFGMARFWMPCLDTLHWYDKCLFDLDVAVKSKDMVVASGELIGTSIHVASDFPYDWDDDTTKVFRYRLHLPAFASEIMIAVGPFIALPDPTLSSTVTHFCLPGRARELVHTAPSLFALSLAFCRDYFGADPPASSYKQLFIGSMGLNVNTTVAGAGGIVIHSGDLLHTKRCIDEAVKAREAIMSGLVMCYFQRFLRPRSTEDAWLISGLEAHVSSLGLQAILGRNWYRFRIWDEIEKLKREDSCDLSHFDTDRVSDAVMDSVRRRSHLIVYMIEKRVGSDVMKRALRDIVAEGRSNSITAVNVAEVVFNVMRKSPCFKMNDKSSLLQAHPPDYERTLRDLNGDPSAHGSLGVVSSGFDEAIQGVSVGPFLKRIRAICGTDVRSMVRLWAASRGIPRMQVGYQYNPRKHTIELVVKQDGLMNDGSYTGRRSFAFTGVVQLRVMEVEGVFDHSVEITEPIFSVELPCHSRRSKHKSAAQAEREFNENPARASPVLWVRFDPDYEWCKESSFKQKEDSWMALLKGERDAMAQFEACRGLQSTRNEACLKALVSTLKDDQVYWRVRAEAANMLASTADGLDKLLEYFRTTYTSAKSEDWDSLYPNNFSNLADYFVKRSILRAVANARVVGSRTAKRPDGTVPIESVKLLIFLLSGHDNKGNEFDDDHYIAEIVESAASAAIGCINDPVHMNTGDGSMSSTEAIKQQLERSRLIEQMIPRRSEVVREALCSALSKIEAAMMSISDIESKGLTKRSLVSFTHEADKPLLRSISQLSLRTHSHNTRITALKSLAEIYGGDLKAFRWILAHVDYNSTGKSIIDVRESLLNQIINESEEVEYIKSYMESPSYRYKVLDLLCEAAASKDWHDALSPISDALRRDTKIGRDICIRLMRLIVADPDPRVQSSAQDLAKHVWGSGIPVCLLARTEYVEAKIQMRRGMSESPRDIAELKTNKGGALPLIPDSYDMSLQMRASKPKGSRSSKSGKSSKHSKGKSSSHKQLRTKPIPRYYSLPIQSRDVARQANDKVSVPVIDLDQPVPKLQQPVEKQGSSRATPTIKIPSSRPAPAKVELKSEAAPKRLAMPRSVPLKPNVSEAKFGWHPLDEEDMKYLRRAWDEKKQEGSSSGDKKVERVQDYALEKGNSNISKKYKDRDRHLHENKERKSSRENGGVEGEASSKKKKKRKRESEDGGHKKKKKKKKHRSDGTHRDSHDGRDHEVNGLDEDRGKSSDGRAKMGKFKIKVSNGQIAPVRETSQ